MESCVFSIESINRFPVKVFVLFRLFVSLRFLTQLFGCRVKLFDGRLVLLALPFQRRCSFLQIFEDLSDVSVQTSVLVFGFEKVLLAGDQLKETDKFNTHTVKLAKN